MLLCSYALWGGCCRRGNIRNCLASSSRNLDSVCSLIEWGVSWNKEMILDPEVLDLTLNLLKSCKQPPERHQRWPMISNMAPKQNWPQMVPNEKHSNRCRISPKRPMGWSGPLGLGLFRPISPGPFKPFGPISASIGSCATRTHKLSPVPWALCRIRVLHCSGP